MVLLSRFIWAPLCPSAVSGRSRATVFAPNQSFYMRHRHSSLFLLSSTSSLIMLNSPRLDLDRRCSAASFATLLSKPDAHNERFLSSYASLLSGYLACSSIPPLPVASQTSISLGFFHPLNRASLRFHYIPLYCALPFQSLFD